jgi:hypothetical protein
MIHPIVKREGKPNSQSNNTKNWHKCTYVISLNMRNFKNSTK